MSAVMRLYESLNKAETQAFLEQSLTSADVLEFAEGDKGVVVTFRVDVDNDEEPKFGSIEVLRNEDGSFKVFSIKIDDEEKVKGTERLYLSDIENLIRYGEN